MEVFFLLIKLSRAAQSDRGSSKFTVKGNVAATKWMENKAATMLSTAHDPTKMSAVSRTQKGGTKITVTCLEVAVTYNQIMGGIDKFDQLPERYAIRRRTLKWWHRIFSFLVDLSIVNAFVLYNTVGL